MEYPADPSDLPRLSDDELPPGPVVTIPALCEAYGVAYNIMLRRLDTWNVPMWQLNARMYVVERRIALNLCDALEIA